MKKFFTQSWALLGLALLTGCAAQTESGTKPDAIRIRWVRDPENLDPLQASTPQAVEAINLLHAGLLQLDYGSRAYQPALAAALPAVQTPNDSTTVLSYRLRPEARWDDDHPVLAADVAFSLKLMYCPGLPNEMAQSQFSFVREVRLHPTDTRRFELVCAGRSPEYVAASGSFAVLPEHVLDSARALRPHSLAALRQRAGGADSALARLARAYLARDPARHPERLSGCGPYRLTSWERDRSLSFRRKPNWWADAVPAPRPAALLARPAQLRYAIVPDETTATLALQRGELDCYPQMPARAFARLRADSAARPRLQLLATTSFDLVTAGFNTRRPVLADAGTRQALSRLFDADGLLQATQLGTGQRTVGLIGPADRLRYNDSLALLPYSPAEAAARLRQAGWQQGPAGWARGPQRLRLLLRYRPDEPAFEPIALQFREAARRLGIAVELRPTDPSAFNKVLQTGDFDVYLRTIKGNPFVFNFAPILHTKSIGQGNLTGFGTPTSDRLIEAIAAADTPAHEARLLRRLQTLMQEQAPLVPLFYLANRLAANNKLQGVRAYDLRPGYVATAFYW